MTKYVTVTVSKELADWVKGLSNFDLGDPAMEQWQAANDVFFERTQRFAHIISGDMKRSGRMETSIEGKQIIGETTYGGVTGTKGPVDYTVYELARGGSHDFIARALASTTSTLQDGLYEAIVEQMRHNLKAGG